MLACAVLAVLYALHVKKGMLLLLLSVGKMHYRKRC